MDKSWMLLSDKCDPRFAQGITAFIEFVKQKTPWTTTHPCPCRCCRLHRVKLSLDEIYTHLFINGMMREYTTWTSHGEEALEEASSSLYTQRKQYVMEKSRGRVEDGYYFNPTIDILNDAFPFRYGDCDNEYFGKDAFDKYQRLITETQTPIYVGSDHTILDIILKAMRVKVDNGWSDKSFNDHLTITRDLLPKGNNYPVLIVT
ncbi:unnamed protein product [Rhodiola kirilowii]